MLVSVMPVAFFNGDDCTYGRFMAFLMVALWSVSCRHQKDPLPAVGKKIFVDPTRLSEVILFLCLRLVWVKYVFN